jgi:MFS family permease
MSEKISLKDAERKAFKFAFQDGLWDILIACFTLMFVIGPYLSSSLGDFWSSAIFLPFWALAYLMIWLIRKFVVKPRIGSVRFGSSRKTRLLRFNLLSFIILLAFFILGILTTIDFASLPGWITTARFGLGIFIVFTLAGYFLQFNELYIYGLLIAFSPIVGEWLYVNLKVPHHGFPLAFGITTGIILIIGLFKFVRILRKYPPFTTDSLSGQA